MTTLHVLFIMLALGALVFFFVSGGFVNRKSESRRLRRQWWLGVIAGLVIIASPLSTFVRPQHTGIDLLTQSLLVAAIGLLALLLYALLAKPFRKSRGHRKSHTDEKPVSLTNLAAGTGATTGLTPIAINADADTETGAVEANETFSQDVSSSVTLDRSPSADTGFAPKSDASNQDKSDSPTDVQAEFNQADKDVATTDKAVADSDELTLEEIDSVSEQTKAAKTSTHPAPYFDPLRDQLDGNDNAKTVAADQANNQKLNTADIESVLPVHDQQNGPHQVDDLVSHASAANDFAAEERALDLSETEEIYAELRQQSNAVDLPDDDELRMASESVESDPVAFDSELVIGDADNSEHNDRARDGIVMDSIEEAEVVEQGEEMLEFGNDLTGQYAHPDNDEMHTDLVDTAFEQYDTESTSIPETLDDALIAAKVTARSLQTQMSSLEQSITELDEIRSANEDAEHQTREQQISLIDQKNALLKSENEARAAAESVIAAQSVLIEQTRRQQKLITNLLDKERQKLDSLRLEVSRSRKMAKSAAVLARKAAVAQQATRNLAKREQEARLKSQESTRKAVNIARNAISALAAEEKKRGLTRH